MSVIVMQTQVIEKLDEQEPLSCIVPCRWLLFGVVILVVLCICSAGCTGTGSSSGSPPGQETTIQVAGSPVSPVLVTTSLTTAASGPAVTIDLVAREMAFNASTITVPAGASVTVNFHNHESPGSSQVTGIAHNFAVYDSPTAAVMIFSGEIITGGGDAVYRFTAPATPGIYFFRCDVHPALMTGRFIVR